MFSISEKRIGDLRRMTGGVDIRESYYQRVAYGFDATGIKGLCAAVAFPNSLRDLAKVVKAASDIGLAVVPRGAGTGFSGGAVPPEGSLVVSTEKMRQILSFDEESCEVEVESGVVNGDLQEFLETSGFFYPPDPASFRVSTIGGNIAENAGGPRAYKYGVTRRYVRSLRWVTIGGEIVESSMEGATSLLTGSEGTLGTIYSAILTVFPVPRRRKTFLLGHGSGGNVLDTASELLRSGFRPSVLEYIDSKTMECVGEYMGISHILDTRSDYEYLFLEVEGTDIETEAQAKLLRDYCGDGDFDLTAAEADEDRELLWDLRRSISPSLARRGVTKVNEDIALPLSALPEASIHIHEAAVELDLDCYIFGHCGDGNLHINIMTDSRRAEEMKRVNVFVEEVFSYVAARDGALSGEHGIGLTKKPYLEKVFDQRELKMQNEMKLVFDPGGTLNPGKYFDCIGC